MENFITLPAPVSAALMITVKPCGQLANMNWIDGHGLSPSAQAEITATTKAAMFKGGRLCLESVTALRVLLEAAHNTACSSYSAYQEKHGFNDTKESLTHDAEIDTACAMEMRARNWVTAYPVTTGAELARVLVGLIGDHNTPTDLNQAELNAVRDMARVIIAGKLNNTHGPRLAFAWS